MGRRHKQKPQSAPAPPAAAPPAAAPPPAPTTTPALPPLTPAERRDAGVNTLIAVVAAVVVVVTIRFFRPAWVSDQTLLYIVLAAVALGLSIFKYIFDAELKEAIRRWMCRRVARIIVTTALTIEIAIVVVLLLPPRIVRIIPGPQVGHDLGYPGQVLLVEWDGHSYKLDSPQSKPFYFASGLGDLQHGIDVEKDVRPDALRRVLQVVYCFVDEDDIAGYLKPWSEGEPQRMRWSGNAKPGRRATLISTTDRIAMTLSPVGSLPEKAIQTYEAEKPLQPGAPRPHPCGK